MTVVNTQLRDKINQVVLVGDLIVHYNNIYKVISLGKLSCKAKLIDPSPTTRPKTKDNLHARVYQYFQTH